MSWTLLIGLVVALGVATFAALSRRAELRRMQGRIRDRDRAVRAGSAKAQLQHPVIDLSRCLGCGACVRVCPEGGVLELVHGQAMVVNGARCTGVSACERECPVGAITVTLTELEERRDVPVLTEDLEAVGTRGLFLAGEVTAHALIKVAVEQGTAVAEEVARRVAGGERGEGEVLDLCIVGAGPAGLACALESKRLGLYFVVLDQESEVGGTVAKYPRRKLVLTQPVDLPLHGRLSKRSYTKEELVELWHRIAREQELPLSAGEVFTNLEKDEEGGFLVHTTLGVRRARHVCLALGRRGSPRKLEVPGEELPKVAYSLLDAHSYAGRRVLVVGGGDSAVETAVGLAEQPGTEVTLSYRQDAFFRVRARSEERLHTAMSRGNLRVALQSRVLSIREDAVDLEVQRGSSRTVANLPNDDVFVMAGGVMPIPLLERAGVSFDPELRQRVDPVVEQGTGLVRALVPGFALALVALAFALWNADYYLLPTEARPVHVKHLVLRPGQGLGLALGIAATVLIVFNLAYLLRRSQRLGFTFGSLRTWMTSHVATGILALLCAALHGAMDPRDTVGGHALWALAVLLVTGAIGRYFYAYVPRAANGRELELSEIRQRLSRLLESWDKSQLAFAERAQAEISSLIDAHRWKGTFLGRVLGIVRGQRDLRQLLARLEAAAHDEGVPEEVLHETLSLAKQAHRSALMTAHFEELRSLLNGWRYVHRWFAALMLVLLAVHVAYAMAYGGALRGSG